MPPIALNNKQKNAFADLDQGSQSHPGPATLRFLLHKCQGQLGEVFCKVIRTPTKSWVAMMDRQIFLRKTGVTVSEKRVDEIESPYMTMCPQSGYAQTEKIYKVSIASFNETFLMKHKLEKMGMSCRDFLTCKCLGL